MAMPDAIETNGWRNLVLDAAIRQGPSFVILLLILYGIWSFGNYAISVAVPAHLQQIQAGYQQIQEQHNRNLERVIHAVEDDQLLMQEAVRELKAIRQNAE